MNERVRRDGATARKRLDDRRAAHGRWVQELSGELRRRGLVTPSAHYEPYAHELVFDWIDGESGRELLREGNDISQAQLRDCLAPLAILHSIDPTGLSLTPFDPWHRIQPRIVSVPGDEEVREAAQRAAATLTRVFKSGGATPVGSVDRPPVVVHGDYHVGQLVFETSARRPWLLDLDDAALGPVEADLGNFLAHFASANLPPVEHVRRSFVILAPPLRHIYADLTDIETNATWLTSYAALALLRRALKLNECRAPSKPLLALLALSDELAQTGPIA